MVRMMPFRSPPTFGHTATSNCQEHDAVIDPDRYHEHPRIVEAMRSIRELKEKRLTSTGDERKDIDRQIDDINGMFWDTRKFYDRGEPVRYEESRRRLLDALIKEYQDRVNVFMTKLDGCVKVREELG